MLLVHGGHWARDYWGYRAHQVERPLLVIHGAKDTRVNVRESEQMVAALKQAGKEVRYVVFPDEGHSRDYGNWRNALRHYAEVEEFLAGCLGGRRSRLLDQLVIETISTPR
ncbi:MAG: prolyl oligopeptidase family serine peptidase [Candidatus Rokubacteria bacterium]|nr:prolyl oligopeptidase family serine peptidase [Candidatus Rokubacteria bacterium]